jgi:hypothetical protein
MAHVERIEIMEAGELVAVETRGSSYTFVSPRRARKSLTAVIVDPPPALDDDDLRATGRFRASDLAAIAAAPYRDPNLCACGQMLRALEAKAVTVVVAGPVTLPPAVLDDAAIASGGVDGSRLGQAYDGKRWAFRHCPFGGCLIDDQVPILPQEDPMSCCGTMALAVAHGRVELPDPARIDQVLAKFVAEGRRSTHFSRCPWCATETIDLAIARHKRSRGL